MNLGDGWQCVGWLWWGVDGETSISDSGHSLVAETSSSSSDSDCESDDGSHEPSFRWCTSPWVWTLSWLQRKSFACEDSWNGPGVIEVNTVTDHAACDESVWKICFTGIYHGRLQNKNLLLEISGPFATQYLSKDCILSAFYYLLIDESLKSYPVLHRCRSTWTSSGILNFIHFT